MLWAVAGRFHFADSEIQAMRGSRLRFWYRGHEFMSREEKTAQAQIVNAAMGGGRGS